MDVARADRGSEGLLAPSRCDQFAAGPWALRRGVSRIACAALKELLQ